MAPDKDLEKTSRNAPISMEEVEGEVAQSLPDKEVMSLLDVNADVDLGLDLAAPIDLAAAANLNVAAPIEAAASANVLSPDANAVAVAQQSGSIDQGITGEANATAQQDATITQGAETGTAPAPTDGTTDATEPTQLAAGTPSTGELDTATDGVTDTVDDTVDSVTGGISSFLSGGSLLSADVNIDADANLTAPVSGAVAANANVAAPVDAAVAANVGSEGATAQALAQQDVNIVQDIDADATATADQQADVEQQDS